MTFGTTVGKSWVEALPTRRSTSFTGRTFSRFHFIGNNSLLPTIGEIWATSDHVVQAHAHDCDELLYVLNGAIEVNKRKLEANDVVFIPRGTSYNARVLSDNGSRVLRIEMPSADNRIMEAEYDARIWQGALTEEGVPSLTTEVCEP